MIKKESKLFSGSLKRKSSNKVKNEFKVNFEDSP